VSLDQRVGTQPTVWPPVVVEEHDQARPDAQFVSDGFAQVLCYMA
jgi:hypothetical protein